MTAHEISKDLDVHPQTVLRVIRAMKKDTPSFFVDVQKVGLTKREYDFTLEQANTVKSRVQKYSRKFRVFVMRPSTASQRAAWFAVWKTRLETANHGQWQSIAGVMGLIFLTNDAEFLLRPMGIGRVGDHIAALIESILGEFHDDFANWLQENGFSSVNIVL